MVVIELSKEELYVVERDADIASGIASKNLFKLVEQFLLCGACDKENPHNELRKLIMANIQEHHRSSEIYDSIRKKCEALRNG